MSVTTNVAYNIKAKQPVVEGSQLEIYRYYSGRESGIMDVTICFDP